MATWRRTWLVACALGLDARRRMLQAGQRSLATLFVLPLVALCLGTLGLKGRELCIVVLGQIQPTERLEAWMGILARAWVAVAIASTAVRLLAAVMDSRPSAFASLPVSLRVLAAAKALPWIVLGVLALASVSALVANAMGPTVGFYHARGWIAGGLVAGYISGAMVLGIAAGSVADLVAARLGPSASALRWVRTAVILGIGAALTCVASAGFSAPLGSSWMRRGLWALLAGGEPWGWLGRLAAIPTAATIVIASCAWLAPGNRHSRRCSSSPRFVDWDPPRSPWSAFWALDLRLLRREPAGLFTALVAQLAWVGSLLVLLGSPVSRKHGEEALHITFENLALAMPAFWGSLAVISPALGLRGGGQLLAAPVALIERTWGKFCAAFTFGFANWIVGAFALAAVFERPEPVAAAGRGIAILALSVAAAYLAGLLLPIDLRAGFSGVSSLCSFTLAVAFLVVPASAIAYATNPLGSSPAAMQVQVLLAFAAIVGLLHSIQRAYLRHGFRAD